MAVLIQGLRDNQQYYGFGSNIEPLQSAQTPIETSFWTSSPSNIYNSACCALSNGNIYVCAIYDSQPSAFKIPSDTSALTVPTVREYSDVGLWAIFHNQATWDGFYVNYLNCTGAVPIFFDYDEFVEYITTPQVSYNWVSVPSVSGKNGILSLATLNDVNNGDEITTNDSTKYNVSNDNNVQQIVTKIINNW